MPENQPLLQTLLAAAGMESENRVDIDNLADVEKFLGDIVMGANRLSDAEFAALPVAAQNWLNAVAQAMNQKQNLIAASSDHGVALADLPIVTAPVGASEAQTEEDGGGDAQEAETPPTAPVSRPESQEENEPSLADSKPAGKVAYSKRNPWGRGTKSHAAISAVIASNGGAAHDIDALSKSTGIDSKTSLKQSVNYALQTFDCMRQAEWLDVSNPAVQSFINSIEVES